MFDTNVFNHIVRDDVDVGSLPAKQRLFVTHVQHNELQATRNDAKREELLAVFASISAKKVPTETALWGESEWGGANFSDGSGPFSAMLDALNKRNGSKQNNHRDVLIGETALLNTHYLVTDDRDLAETVREFGGKTMTLQEFLRSADSE